MSLLRCTNNKLTTPQLKETNRNTGNKYLCEGSSLGFRSLIYTWVQVSDVAKSTSPSPSGSFSCLKVIPSLARWQNPCLGQWDCEDVGRTSLANGRHHLLVGYIRGTFLPVATTWGVKKQDLPAVLLKLNPNKSFLFKLSQIHHFK